MQTAGFPAVSGARSLLCILAVVGWAAPREAGAATITISGQVNDAQGLPLRGVSVRLYRNGPPDLDTTTDVNGRFSWTTAPGRYRVEPKLFNCTFLPNERGLPNVTSSVNILFGGSGPGCGGQATVNAGAWDGALTLSGHVRDATGNPVVGARIDLSGPTQAVRFTDLTGGYAFHVDPGTYGIAASGQCPMTPATTKVAVSASTVRDFAGGAGCVTATRSNVIATGAVFTVSSAGTVLGTSFANLAQFATAGDAQARLQEIAAEQAAPYPLAHDRRVPCHRAPAGRDARTPRSRFPGRARRQRCVLPHADGRHRGGEHGGALRVAP